MPLNAKRLGQDCTKIVRQGTPTRSTSDFVPEHRAYHILPRLQQVLFGKQVRIGWLADPRSQAIQGDWKPVWPRQSYPTYDDAPLKILERLSEAGKRQAFTHQTVNAHHNYEELEWVGDAALELLARRMISRKYPKLKLGEKSRLAQTVVRGTALSRLALSIGLAQHIRCRSDHLTQSVLEDVMESLLAVMTEELGDKEAYIWLESVMSPMLEEHKNRLFSPASVPVFQQQITGILIDTTRIRAWVADLRAGWAEPGKRINQFSAAAQLRLVRLRRILRRSVRRNRAEVEARIMQARRVIWLFLKSRIYRWKRFWTRSHKQIANVTHRHVREPVVKLTARVARIRQPYFILTRFRSSMKHQVTAPLVPSKKTTSMGSPGASDSTSAKPSKRSLKLQRRAARAAEREAAAAVSQQEMTTKKSSPAVKVSKVREPGSLPKVALTFGEQSAASSHLLAHEDHRKESPSDAAVKPSTELPSVAAGDSSAPAIPVQKPPFGLKPDP